MDIQHKLSQSAAVTAGIAAAGLAVGAAVMGACAIGALAISAMAMRKVATRGGHVDKLSVGELTVDRLLVKDPVNHGTLLTANRYLSHMDRPEKYLASSRIGRLCFID